MKNVSTWLLLITVSIALFIIGCVYKKVDSLTYFKLSGKVFEKDSNSPIIGASIFFIDKGFDDRRERDIEPINICKSDKNGQVNCLYEYFWGRTEGWFRNKATKEFVIEITKDGYDKGELFFNANALLRVGNEYQVNMGNIFLKKR